MKEQMQDEVVTLDTAEPIWERFFMVHPLVVIGTRDETGEYNLSPKHMAMPMGWDNYFGCMGSPHHRTYQNIEREACFTVSFPRPSQIVEASLTATLREQDSSKPVLSQLPTFRASKIDSVFLRDGYLYFECLLHRIVDGFAANSLITGRIIAAHVHKNAMRTSEIDDNEMIYRTPLLAYLQPGRFARVRESQSFPFPMHFQR